MPSVEWLEDEVRVWKVYEEEVGRTMQEIDCEKLLRRLLEKGVNDAHRVAFLVLRRVASMLTYFPHLRQRALEEAEKCRAQS